MGPTPSTTGSFTGFLNLSMMLLLLLPSHHFQMGDAPGVTPFRGFDLLQKLPDSSPETCPHDFSPNSCATFDLGKGPAGHACHDPGSRIKRHDVFIVFRAFVFAEIDSLEKRA